MKRSHKKLCCGEKNDHPVFWWPMMDKSKESIDSSTATVVEFCDSKELFMRKFPDMNPYTQEALADRVFARKI